MNDNWDSVRNITEDERERFMIEQNASAVNISDEARCEHERKLALLDMSDRTKEESVILWHPQKKIRKNDMKKNKKKYNFFSKTT